MVAVKKRENKRNLVLFQSCQYKIFERVLRVKEMLLLKEDPYNKQGLKVREMLMLREDFFNFLFFASSQSLLCLLIEGGHKE